MTAPNRRPILPRGRAIAILAMLLPTALVAQQSTRGAEKPRARYTVETNEDLQPTVLPTMPYGMTVDMLVEGDRLFHGKGGCVNCHGSEAQGLAARGKTLTAGVQYVPAGDWNALDSLINVGLPDGMTRSPIAMPARGQHGDLGVEETRAVAAYVWAISQTKGEPWSGGHALHAPHDWRASSRTSIP